MREAKKSLNGGRIYCEGIVQSMTDGILLKRKPNVNKLNSFLANKIDKLFGIKNSTLVLEEETFERGFIHRMKNYMLIEKDKAGNLHEIIHGAYFKSSRASKVYDDAVKNVIKWALYDQLEEQEARDLSLDIRSRPMEDFIMRVKLSKNIKDYITSTSEYYDDIEGFNPIMHENIYKSDFALNGHQIIDLANQCKIVTGQMPEKGSIVEYFIAMDPITGKKKYQYYNPSDANLINRVNYEMYEKQLNKLFEETNIASYRKTATEDNWLDELV